MKKILFFLLVVVFALTMSANTAFAGTTAGSIELSGALSLYKLTGIDDYDLGAWNLLMTVGYFATDALQINVTGIVSGQFGDNAPDDSTNGFIYGGFNYHFNTAGDLVPYIGLSGGTDIGDDSSDEFLVEGHGGLKHFVGERVSINYQIGYATTVSSDEGASDYGVVQASIGVGTYF